MNNFNHVACDALCIGTMWHFCTGLAHSHCSGTSLLFLLLSIYSYVPFVPLNNPREIDRMTIVFTMEQCKLH